MVGRDLPNIYALALGCCAPSGSCVYIRQISPDHVITFTYIAIINYTEASLAAGGNKNTLVKFVVIPVNVAIY